MGSAVAAPPVEVSLGKLSLIIRQRHVHPQMDPNEKLFSLNCVRVTDRSGKEHRLVEDLELLFVGEDRDQQYGFRIRRCREDLPGQGGRCQILVAERTD